MKQKSQPVRSQLWSLIMTAVAGVGFATTVNATDRNAGFKSGTEAGFKGIAPNAAQAGGGADGHMSPVAAEAIE